MQIVRAAPVDAVRVAELAAATFPLACPSDTSQADIDTFIAQELTVERFAAHLTHPARTVLLATDDTRPVGYVLMVHEPPSDANVRAVLNERATAEMSKCYVRAECHGSGLATRLIEAAVADAAEHGARSLWLGVSSVNERAQRCYRKNGFVPVGYKDFHVGSEHFRDVVMERCISV